MSILTRLVGLATLLLLTACGTGSIATASGSATGTVAGDPSQPAGVIAMGHSGLTGEGTAELYGAGLENSWATGTNPDVNSVYLRLVDVRPENADQVANTAVGGSPASELVRQTESALAQVPYPQLAIVQTIDSDIHCDGTDDEHVPEFGQALADALHTITSASPKTKILVVGQLGRPNVEFIKALVKLEPDERNNLMGSGPCDFFDTSGKLVPQNFETLTGIIDAYEAEQARVCADVANCMTDGGVRRDYVDVIENFSSDFNHLNIAGQAAEAALIWPVVEDLLGL